MDIYLEKVAKIMNTSVEMLKRNYIAMFGDQYLSAAIEIENELEGDEEVEEYKEQRSEEDRDEHSVLKLGCVDGEYFEDEESEEPKHHFFSDSDEERQEIKSEKVGHIRDGEVSEIKIRKVKDEWKRRDLWKKTEAKK